MRNGVIQIIKRKERKTRVEWFIGVYTQNIN